MKFIGSCLHDLHVKYITKFCNPLLTFQKMAAFMWCRTTPRAQRWLSNRGKVLDVLGEENHTDYADRWERWFKPKRVRSSTIHLIRCPSARSEQCSSSPLQSVTYFTKWLWQKEQSQHMLPTRSRVSCQLFIVMKIHFLFIGDNKFKRICKKD